MKNILIIGASSAIAAACAHRWALKGARLFLAGRQATRLDAVARDLRVRGAKEVHTRRFDVNNRAQHTAMLNAARAALGSIDVVLIAHGTLADQTLCERDVNVAVREFTTNALSTIALLTLIAPILEAQRSGTLAVISSVAGERGRASNYLYGAAKAAVTTFCEGLRVRLFKADVRVLTIKPGFVATPMTAGLALPRPLVASPERVAADIVRAVARGKDTLYTPWFWSAIMLVIRSLPRFVFKRVSL
ncbi:SDR family oxidoreductase [Paraburkholderia bannensis]|uniref:SDR family oxidoreductase n=1 Tax=Paraburkholderia bannensis TaxID=765414 RepID=UPI002ABE1375|nr:SDR family oxidoreductase [Paraburkholderia bannensis]